MASKIQFGVYELDRETAELRKHGVLIRLQEQPLQVLTALVERPGEVVTREGLRERIWGKDTFVDFEQSLNKAVNRLREALCDDAARPRYIETVPRRGYRFVAPVTPISSTVSQPPTEPSSAEFDSRAQRQNAQRRKIAALVAGLALAGIGGLLGWRMSQKSALPEVRHVTSAAFCCPALSRDGKLLAYVSAVEGGVPHIWLRQTAGGEAIPVTNGPDGDYDPDFSPDGTHIAFWSSGGGSGVYTAPTFGGERKLIAKGDFGEPRFSPNGEKIMYWDNWSYFGDSGATIVSVDGKQQTQPNLNRDFFVQGQPFWSPSGDDILFYGIKKREPERPGAWWIAPLSAGEASKVVFPGPDPSEIADHSVAGWVRDDLGREWIVYSVSKELTWKLYRVPVSAHGQMIGRPEQLASGTGVLESGISVGVSVSLNGRLVYITSSSADSIYEIPISGEGRKSGPTFRLPLPEGSDYRSPSVSRDGRWMAYDVSKNGLPSPVFLRDLANSTDHSLYEMGGVPGPVEPGDTSISPDGSKIIFTSECKGGQWKGTTVPCAFLIAAAGGEPEQICEFCVARGFSSTASTVLIQKLHPLESDTPHDRIAIIDLTSRTEKDFLSSPGSSLYHAFFSWDDHWVVFKKVLLGTGTRSQLLITPFRNGAPGKQAEWIPVTDGLHSDDKPQFSPDGNTLFFTSTRDGYLCIWAQRLDPTTKHPVGSPFAFEHFHNSAGAYGTFGIHQFVADFSVARDKMLINLPQVHSDIWMTQVH